MPKPVMLPPTDKTPEEIARAILNFRPPAAPTPRDLTEKADGEAQGSLARD